MEYKTSEPVRNRATLYYRQHRDEVLRRLAADRRADGVPLRRRMTRDERLAKVRNCRKCGVQITQSWLLIHCQNTCPKCKPRYARKGPRRPKNPELKRAALRRMRKVRTALI